MRDAHQKGRALGTLISILLSWALVALPAGFPLVHWSYDLLQAFLPTYRFNDIAIVQMDQQAMQDYQQKPGTPWPRSVHARLLDRLTQDRPKVVVFDVTFSQPEVPAVDEEFARAIRRNGRVVLAGDRVPLSGLSLAYTLVPPLAEFETHAASWGIAKVQLDADRVGRRYDAGNDQAAGLDWAAATVVGAPVTLQPERRLNEVRWLNYYGSARPFESTSMTYTNAETRPLGFFADKAVFIGGKPETLLRGEITDVFGTPFTHRNSVFIPGVEITAMAYANLVHQDWLRRLGILAECGVLLLTGWMIGFGAQRIRLKKAAWLALMIVLLLPGVALLVLLTTRIWFPWTIVAVVQIPCVLIFQFLNRPDSGVIAVPGAGSIPAGTPSVEGRSIESAPNSQPRIPDHTLIRCIGEGAYGQVWIARNAVGIYHAIKVVYRNRFSTEVPYERAFRGIQKFMPISRSHEGFVHILHVGRNDAAGSFFYIMEAGDDETTGQQIDPKVYVPRTLANELKKRDRLPAQECLEFMLEITAATERLHQHQLIHRDIKPANIIFVNRHPKLADIDLVTDLSSQGDVSRIGTDGYLAPEGPGRATGDVFSLGRILYVALTGKAPDQCPELPTSLASEPDCDLALELNRVSCKACDFNLQRRYASAAMMRSDLLELSARRSSG